MKILHLTPGTGNFYCGLCIRDNALAHALRQRGHDVTMVPLYLPHLTDEPAAAGDTPIFFGGINVYLQQKSALFRNTPRWLDRIWDSPMLLRQSAKMMSMTRAHELGEMTLSMLRGEEGKQAKELEKLIDWLKSQPAPEIITISTSMLLGMARRLKQEFGARLICSLQGEDSFLDSLPEPYRAQSWQLLSERAADADQFIAVSHYYGDLMRKRAKLPADRVTVIWNGINLEGYAPAGSPPNPPRIGFLAQMSPAKNLGLLVDAFILLKQKGRIPNLQLGCAGSMTGRDEIYVKAQVTKLKKNGLEKDVEFHPNLDRVKKQEFFRSLSVFSVPATYGEAFGLYLIEAMASGVPVVQPRHAAFPELIEATGGGLLCEPNDANSLADALESLLLDPAKARQLGQQGQKAVMEKFNVERMANEVEAVFKKKTAK